MKNTPFTVPENYFDTLAQAIEAKCKQENSLQNLPRENVFTVPPTYFAELPEKIAARLSPTSLPVEKPAYVIFEVPADYFENLSHQILRKVNQSKAPQKVPFFNHRWQVATVIGGVLLVVFGWWGMQQSHVPDTLGMVKIIAPPPQDKTSLESPKQVAEKNPALPTEVQASRQGDGWAIAPVAAKPDNIALILASDWEHDELSPEEAIELLAANDGDAASEMTDEWQDEELLHELSEEIIQSLPNLLKK